LSGQGIYPLGKVKSSGFPLDSFFGCARLRHLRDTFKSSAREHKIRTGDCAQRGRHRIRSSGE
jgi:hypothetical protein